MHACGPAQRRGCLSILTPITSPSPSPVLTSLLIHGLSLVLQVLLRERFNLEQCVRYLAVRARVSAGVERTVVGTAEKRALEVCVCLCRGVLGRLRVCLISEGDWGTRAHMLLFSLMFAWSSVPLAMSCFVLPVV